MFEGERSRIESAPAACQSSQISGDTATRALRPDKGVQSPPRRRYRPAHIAALSSEERRIAASSETRSPSRADISGSGIIVVPPLIVDGDRRVAAVGGGGGTAPLLATMAPLIKVHLFARFHVDLFAQSSHLCIIGAAGAAASLRVCLCVLFLLH